MLVDYEEKTFENFFNIELSKYSMDSPYSIGQVREGLWGFDAMAHVMSPVFWKYVRFANPAGVLSTTDLNKYFKKKLANVYVEANILLQYKRPEYMKRNNATEWKLWNKAYFRYYIYEHQQKILESVQNEFKDKAVVLYVSPTASNENALFDLVAMKKLIETSNYTRAVDLRNHRCNTYIRGGTCSKACSDVSEISWFNFKRYIETPNGEYENAESFINKSASIIESIMLKDRLYERFFQKKNRFGIQVFANSKLLRSFYVISTFCMITGVQWRFKISHEIRYNKYKTMF